MAWSTFIALANKLQTKHKKDSIRAILFVLRDVEGAVPYRIGQNNSLSEQGLGGTHAPSVYP